MIGLHAGNRSITIGAVIGGPSSSSVDFLGLGLGQSNNVGFSDAAATGSGNHSGGDTGLAYFTPFTATKFNQTSAPAPSSPMNWSTNTGTIALQPYAAGGGNNTGMMQRLGRFLVQYGFCKAPALINCGIGSTSIPANWLPASNYPASGEKVYAHLRDFINARKAEYGRQVDVIFHQIGETDAGTQAHINSCVQDLTDFYTALRADCGLAGVPIIMSLINSQTSGGIQGVLDYRAQQQIYISNNSSLVFALDPSDIPLESDPHYLMGGYDTLGILFAEKIRDILRPSFDFSLQSGPCPWVQGGAACYTASASPNTSRPMGWSEARNNDVELLVTHGSLVAHTVTLTVANGFTQQLAQTESVTGAAHRSIMAWTRVCDTTTLNSHSGRMLDPTIDFGSGTLNSGQIWCIRGAQTATPIATIVTGANNASNNTLTIGDFTAPANSLALMVVNTNQVPSPSSGPKIGSISGGMSGATLLRDSAGINPGSGTINMSAYWKQFPAGGSIGSTTITTTGLASLNVGAIFVFQP